MTDIDKLARTIKEDAAKTGVVEDAHKIVRPEEYDWFVKQVRDTNRRMLGGGNDE